MTDAKANGADLCKACDPLFPDEQREALSSAQPARVFDWDPSWEQCGVHRLHQACGRTACTVISLSSRPLLSDILVEVMDDTEATHSASLGR